MKDFGLKKLYYSISEVSKLTDLEQYILRYWETEFEQLKPQKNRAGNRIYTNKDIKLILQIKKLLREEKYTIEGAKNILASGVKIESPALPKKVIPQNNVQPKTEKIPSIKKDLEELKIFLLDLKSQL
ncbi:MAG: MerR family transcriptional regulator [Melioribacteraceae bacterium]|nr:MerR family transcriptional regulator [Melioribacteraceae bacterium]MCF8352897.1 MerR family transcriptional regulator [Melioribacteraceae bacterium]MCF8393786.1 MerR family transcriptional regulator [Melioribacteraceae bacterium]MCF8417414.1 MerR family transcriptional regulator [Melioribacteraceae bacterium]